MKRRLIILVLAAVALVAAGAVAGRLLYRAYPVQMSLFAGLTRNYVRSWGAPPGATSTELNPAYKTAAAAPALSAVAVVNAAGDDWPSYNRTLTSERYSPLADINAKTVGAAQNPLHVRHQTIHQLRDRPHHGPRGADWHDADRHFLDRPGDLRRELAHARGPSRHRS